MYIYGRFRGPLKNEFLEIFKRSSKHISTHITYMYKIEDKER